MNITDELERLGKLHKDGTLTDEEFAQAKAKLLNQQEISEMSNFRESMPSENSLGQAANRYVSFQIVMAVIGAIIFLIFLFSVILPSMNGHSNHGIEFQMPGR